ncbi:RidA family protein [Massilia sp. GCM10020059]|uniref:RidA family protein n=1 Tax=Massilia agrisoli TaxID=2892444 RepID=A0ABS8IT70_9BURK|nr:RidA family protein [Massilia agrisoli]MCC6071825.1 RidA family protein [Massilia agrisoli]
MKLIQARGLPAPAGHYSQAVEANGLVFLSGVLPQQGVVDPNIDTFQDQCESVFGQCEKILQAAGCGFQDVVQCTVYVVGIANWPEFNAIYARVFGAHKPARAVVPVPELHFGYSVEVQMTAALPAA